MSVYTPLAEAKEAEAERLNNLIADKIMIPSICPSYYKSISVFNNLEKQCSEEKSCRTNNLKA